MSAATRDDEAFGVWQQVGEVRLHRAKHSFEPVVAVLAEVFRPARAGMGVVVAGGKAVEDSGHLRLGTVSTWPRLLRLVGCRWRSPWPMTSPPAAGTPDAPLAFRLRVERGDESVAAQVDDGAVAGGGDQSFLLRD